MARILILVALAVALLWWLFGRKRGGPSRPAPQQRGARQAPAAEMVACAHCGVHLPREDAVADNGGRVYCGDPHRLAGPR